MKWAWAVAIVLNGFEGVRARTIPIPSLTALTPATLVECEQTNLTWFGGTPPYAISLLANDANGFRALGYAGIPSTSFVTKLPFAAGQSLELLVRDAAGAQAISATFQVQSTKASSSSCALDVTPRNQNNTPKNQTLVVTSPTVGDSIAVCDSSFTVSWQGGQGPYNLLLQTANKAVMTEQAYGGSVLDGGSINTRVQLPAGSEFQVIVADSAGTFASSGMITLANGGESDCVITNQADSTTKGPSFRVAGAPDVSAVILPTPTLHTFVSATAPPTLAAGIKPKESGSSKTVVAIVASIVSVGAAGLGVALFFIWRAHKRNKRPRVDLLGGSGRNMRQIQPNLDPEIERRFQPTPYYLPSLPAKTASPATGYGSSRTVSSSREVHPQLRRVTNPDEYEDPVMGPFSDKKAVYDDYDHPPPLSPLTIVGPVTWEDEKSMLR